MVMAMQSINSSTPSARAQLSQYQAQLQQARQEAAQAADRVTRLEQQAQVARQESVRADEKVRGIESQPPRSDTGNSGPTGARKRINTLSQLSGTVLDVTA
jgi:multidrug resistance efflux pump